MRLFGGRTIAPGTLFDDLADRGSPTTVQLSSPLDVAPDAGTAQHIGDLARLVRRLSGWLAAAGVRPGERVAVAKRDHWDYALLACAAARIGAVPALLSGRLPPDTLRTLLKRLEPALLVADGEVFDAARDAGADIGSFARRVLDLDGEAEGALCTADVEGHGAPPVRPRAADEPLAIMHTSGTTGVPKLVVHSTSTLMRRITGFEARRWPVLGTRSTDTVASAISFAHGRALSWTASALWLEPRKLLAVADRDEAEPLLNAHPPTVLEAAPATYVRWQSSAESGPGNPFRRVRLYISTLDAVHPPTVRAFLAASRHRRPVWMQGWGQSETGPLTFRFLTRGALASARDRHPTTRDLGWPVPLRTGLRVVDPSTMQPLPRGREGLVFCRTKALCLGYVGERERWERKRIGEWWNTGDIGSLTGTGGIRLLDREVDRIADGSCLELEDIIDDRLPEVLECVVLGVPGAAPRPVVATADGALDPIAWKAAVADLPELADPVVTTWEAVPRTATGKVRRLALRATMADAADICGSGRWT